MQVFDYHNGYMPVHNASRYDAVWASVQPHTWDSGHPGMVASNYFIMGMDQYSALHHTLSWWQSNHPDWILYACTGNGTPTHDIAYMGGIDVPDMPLDIHNPNAVAYQINTMADYAKAAGYNALAIDQVVYENIYGGGNTAFGQKRHADEYGCGVWQNGSFVRHYASANDRQYASDVVAYVRQAHSILHSRRMTLVINHPGGNTRDPNEQQLLANTDMVMDETGFSGYGGYMSNNGSLFTGTLEWMRYAQQHGTAVMIVNKFVNQPLLDRTGLEYSIATYLLGNQGAALLFAGGAKGYGTDQYHSEYDAPIGKPCSDLTGGPQVFTRRFTGGMAIVNAGLSANSLALPSGKSYRDLEGRPVGNPLHLGPNDAYVLLTSSNGCS